MSFSQLAFSFGGRMRRRDFWLGQILLAFVIAFMSMVAMPAALQLRPPTPVILAVAALGAVVQVLTIWPALAIAVKRGHDRNRPAAWIIAVFALDIAVALACAFDEAFRTWGLPAQAVFLAYVVVDLGLLDGAKAENRFGPSPKTSSFAAPAPAVSAAP